MMRACESYIDLMMRSIDRETTPQEEEKIQNHLAQCEACRALYETYRALDAGMVAAEEEPPETLTRAVMNSIHAEQRERSPRHLLKRFRFTAVAAAAAVLVLVFARFQPNVISVTGQSKDAAAVAEAAVPQVDAELRAADGAADTQESALARAGAAETDEAVEEAAAEEPALAEGAPEAAEMPMESAEDNAETVTEKAVAGEVVLSEQAGALHALGLHGDVMLVSGLSSEALQALFPELTAISLENGVVAYEVSSEAVELAVAAGELTVLEALEEASEYCYLILCD